MEEEYLTVMAAANYLGISRDKLSRMIKAGKLEASENPLDSRSKLIARSQLDALLSKRIISSVEKTEKKELALIA